VHTGVLTDGETWEFYLFKNDGAITDESSNENMSEENKSEDTKAGNSDNTSDQMDGFMEANDPFTSASDQVPKHGISMFTCARVRIEDKRTLQNVFGTFIDTSSLLMQRPLDLFHQRFHP